MGELMNTERVIKGNLCNLPSVLMSLCDSDNKNQVEASIEYVNLEMSLDSMGLPNAIVCTGSTNNSNV